jgi:hypothetical protein
MTERKCGRFLPQESFLSNIPCFFPVTGELNLRRPVRRYCVVSHAFRQCADFATRGGEPRILRASAGAEIGDRRNLSGDSDFARRSPMPIFQSPEFARTAAGTGLRSSCDGTAVTAAEGRRDSRALRVLLPCSDCAGLGQTMPSCSSCLAQDSGRFRASQVTVRSAGARPSAMA